MDYMNKIRQVRIARSYTQADMADQLETTQQQYSAYENGRNELPIRHLITICKEFGISPAWVLGFTDSP